jgi:ribosome-interacting GTPase 1
MPANLPPQYNKAEQEFRAATTAAARLEKLRELFRLLPKHKGTEKLQAELKAKISRAREEVDAPATAGKQSARSFRVSREGAGQIVLIGPPNTGKSALLAALSNAKPEVAPYPFTTRMPQPGMVDVLDVRYQLVDLPPITADVCEPWLPGLIISADAALLVVDLSDDDALDAADAALSRLATARITLTGSPVADEDENAFAVKTLLVANKLDAPGAGDRLEILREWAGDRFPVCTTSTISGQGLDVLRGLSYDLLEMIRVYTKVPGRPADRQRPFTIMAGGTIEDLAGAIHRDLDGAVKFAKVWGTGVHDGQTVKRDHQLHDADVVEIHF